METVINKVKTNRETALEKIQLINKLLLNNSTYHHGFLGGSMGLVYYYYNAYNVLQTSELLQKAEDILAQVFEDVNETGKGIMGASLCNGAAGLGYTVNYLQQHGFIEFDIDSDFAELDLYLFSAAAELIKRDEIDYLHGALGVLLYFTERKNAPAQIKKYIADLTEAICAKAVYTNNGIWFKNYSIERLKSEEVADLGLAHGMCGMLMILMKAAPYVQNKSALEVIIKSGINFILSNQILSDKQEDEYSVFPASVNTATNSITSINRLAWCYGDLNMALLLYRAGQFFLNPAYTNKADELGFLSIDRNTEKSTMCTDTHFCHGSAGLAQIYLCLYNETGIFKYYKAYELWIEKTIIMVDKEIENNSYGTNITGLLEGWAGVAMVLTEYVSEGEAMKWGDAFLL